MTVDNSCIVSLYYLEFNIALPDTRCLRMSFTCIEVGNPFKSTHWVLNLMENEHMMQEGWQGTCCLPFWEAAYERVFNGSTLLASVQKSSQLRQQLSCRQSLPQVNFMIFPLLGAILSHDFLVSGFLPLRIAFPVLASLLIGPCTTTPLQQLMEAFIESISDHDNRSLRSGLSAKKFTAQTTTELLTILSRFGCREMPTPSNLKQLLLQLAKYEFVTKPYAAICSTNQGIPFSHHSFWASWSISDLWQLYIALGATPSKVIELIDEPECLTSNQSRIFGYLIQMIGSMNQDDLRVLLRFITGSSVCLGREYQFHSTPSLVWLVGQ